MNAAVKRIVPALILLGILALAIGLRFYGIDWAFKDGVGHSPHPDERHYQSCADVLNFQWLTDEELQLPLAEQWQLFYQRNLYISNPNASGPGEAGLRPINYNYGTLPLHVYLMYRSYIVHNAIQHTDNPQHWEWVFFGIFDGFSLFFILFTILFALRFYASVLKSFNQSEPGCPPLWRNERKLVLFIPCMLIPLTGLALFFFLPTEVVNLGQYNPNQISIVLIGRIVTAFAGVLTVLLVYLIGRDAYNQATGLVGAMMMATAMLHVQTSHYATVDGIAAFLTTAAIYFFFKITQKPRLLWYVLGAIFTGFAIGSKWSAIILPAMLWFAHAVATWSDNRHGKDGRLIHTVWLILSAMMMLQFFIAAQSKDPLFHITLAQFRDFYLNYWIAWVIGIVVAVITTLVYLFIRKQRNEEHNFFKACFQIYLPWAWLAAAIPVGIAAFLFAQPMAYFDAQAFARDIINVGNINASGISDLVYTKQFNHTLPVITLLDNLFYPTLDYFTAFFVIAGCLFAAFRLFSVKCKSDLFLVAWAIPAFVVYSSLDSKFPRYIVPVLPVMIVLGARLIVDLCRINVNDAVASLPWFNQNMRRFAKGAGWVGGTAALLFGLIYGSAYSAMYHNPHTLYTAGQYVKQVMKPGQTITQNNWDEGINGIHIESDNMIAIHAADDRSPTQRIQYFIGQLQKNDYIVFPSKRGYGTTLHNPEEYPVTNRFLRALFAEQLGFRIAKVIENPVQFMGFHFYVDEEDETADIYDHPKVIVFEKVSSMSPEQISELITNPPDWINQITERDILTLRDGKPVFARPANAPVWRWYVLLFGLGALMFLTLFPLMKTLPDGGYAVSKTIGLAFFSWLAWYLASTQVFLLSQFSMCFVLLVMMGLAWFAWQRCGQDWIVFLKTKWRLLVTIEVLFVVVWIVFLTIRMYHPGISWGEKPMNSSFVNATYRATTFPPEDPWISGHTINYYYYGQSVYSIAGRFMDIPPEYLFNVAGTSVAALVAISIFSITFTISRCMRMPFIAVFLAIFAGHIISFIQFMNHAINRTIEIPWKEWSANLTFMDVLHSIPAMIKTLWYAVLFYTGFASDAMKQELSRINYEHLFWKAGHDLYHGTAANEFPYWTHLFMDFHAHMLVIPFTWAFIGVLLALFLKPHKEIKTLCFGGYSLILALLLGTVICTNTWDMPALVIALITALMVKWYRESDNAWQSFKTAEWLNADTLQSWLRFPFGIIVLVMVLQLVMYYPFHANFAARVSGVGFMTEGHAPLTTFLGYWGTMLFPLIVAAVLAAIVRWDNKLSLPRTIGFALFFILTLSIAFWMTNRIHSAHELAQAVTAQTTVEERTAIQEQSSLYSIPIPPTMSPTDPPFDLTVLGLFLPFLAVLFLQLWNKKLSSEQVFGFLIGFIGLGLVLGIELFHIKEGVWGRPSHRWNTMFKFNIQVWHYLSVFAAFGFVYSFYKLKALRSSIGSFLSISSRLVFGFVFVLLICLTVPFAIIAPYIVTQTGGAQGRDVRDATVPTLDGLAWLRKQHYSTYAGIQWMNRFVAGTPNIVEYVHQDSAYIDYAWFSSYTGLPALMGWEHHVGERLHEDEKMPRRNAVYRIYESMNKEEVVDILANYDIEYLVFGETEMRRERSHRNRTPLGVESLNRFEEWGDVFRLVYRLGDQSIFRIDRSQNRIFGITGNENYMQIPTVTANLPDSTSLHPSAVGGNMFEGGDGEDNGKFNEPRGIAEDANGFFYVADTRNHRLQAFREDGRFEGKSGSEGNNPGEFKEPNDVSVDLNTGNLYIADTWNHRIVKMDNKGNVLAMYAGNFFGPRGIVFHPHTGYLFVCDTGGHQIKVLDTDGQVIASLGIPGGGSNEEAFREPVGIDFIHESGDVVALDSLNKRLKIYNISGQLKSIIPIQTSWDGQGGFEGHVSCSPDGVIYITDPRERSIHAYSQDGRLLGKSMRDKNGNPFIEPIGIHISMDNRIIVSDKGANRIVEVLPFAQAVTAPTPTLVPIETAIEKPEPEIETSIQEIEPTPVSIEEPVIEEPSESIIESTTDAVADENETAANKVDSATPEEGFTYKIKLNDDAIPAEIEVEAATKERIFDMWYMPFHKKREDWKGFPPLETEADTSEDMVEDATPIEENE